VSSLIALFGRENVAVGKGLIFIPLVNANELILFSVTVKLTDFNPIVDHFT